MKSSRLPKLVLILILFSLILGGCNFPESTPPPNKEDAVAAIVAQTQTSIALNALLTATTTAGETSITPTSTQPQATQTSLTSTSAPSTQIPGCTNKAKYVSETVPDNTPFAPGEQFVKTWTLQNAGTCTWTPEYNLVHVNGDRMTGTSPSPIGATVAPNQMIVLSLPQTAPQEISDHQGFWKLSDESGQQFGLGENADVAFWVKITVVEGGGAAGALDLGPPTWIDSFEAPSNTFPLGEGADVHFKIEDGNLIITSLNPVGDRWRIAKVYLDDFLLSARFRTGDYCSNGDSYGVIVRAPDQPDSIIDTGYVFGFSCDGKFRVYRMDSGAFNAIIHWTPNPAINPGTNATNELAVRAVGDALQLYANGTLIYEFNDVFYPGGMFGLMVRSEGSQNFQVSVQQIAYWLDE